MTCPLCGQRKARRACPARGDQICAVCCATKRVVEINCPSDCVYLAASAKHPAAAVRRQQEEDVRAIAASFGALSERQYRLGFLLLTVVMRHRPSDGLLSLEDADLAEAASALAATFETAGRGVIYDHTPTSPLAAALAADLKAFLGEVGRGAGAAFEREAAEVLRAIERGARGTAGEGARAYLDRVARVIPATTGSDAPATEAAGSPEPTIILP